MQENSNPILSNGPSLAQSVEIMNPNFRRFPMAGVFYLQSNREEMARIMKQTRGPRFRQRGLRFLEGSLFGLDASKKSHAD